MKSVKKYEKVYAFIDSQNLNLGTSKDITRNGRKIYKGWKIDMKLFRRYLKDKFRVEKAYLFIGYIKENEAMYELFRSFGYELIFKPTVISHDGVAKGNVDAEIVLYSARIFYEDFNKAVFVSGDGDFTCLYDFFAKEGKLKALIIPNKFSESKLLNEFQDYKAYLYRDRKKLELRQ